LRQQEQQFNDLQVQVLVITFETGPMAEAYVRRTGLPWPLLVDQSRQLYEGYGMLRGRWWDIYGPASWWLYAKLLVQGRRLRRPTDDVHQLGGDVLIDPAGIVRLHHIGRGPADRPEVSRLLEVVRQGAK
jgi:hypothetical protein